MKIITPGTGEPISLAQAHLQCKIDPDEDGMHDDDPLLEVFITAAREWVEVYLGMTISPTRVQINLDAFPDGDLALESGPVVGPASVTYFDPSGAVQTLADSVFVVNTDNQVAVLRLNEGESWPATDGSTDNISVQYSIGYSAAGDSPQDAPVPRSIMAAILLLVAHLYKNRESTIDQALIEMPMGVTFLLRPLQIRLGFA